MRIGSRQGGESLEFLKQLATYFSEFIETGFHASRVPSRKIASKRDGLLTSVPLDRYPEQQNFAWDLIRSGFATNKFDSIDKPMVTANLRISEKHLRDLAYANLNLTDQSERNEFGREVLKCYPYQSISTNGSDASDLIDAITYQANTFHDSLFDLWKNKAVLDKQDFYFYFYDVSFDGVTYPLFYMPVSIERDDTGVFSIEFDPAFFVNKSAIQFVTEHVAEKTGKSWRIDLPQRINYVADFSAPDLLAYLQRTLNELTDFVQSARLDVKRPERSASISDLVTISSRCYFAIFDKADEALVTDYEELILRLDKADEDDAVGSFVKLIYSYMFENPKGFENDVDTEYDARSLTDRLIYASPVPLNREQQQVLAALNKDGCNNIVIQGPPGTGKTHTITAIICDALLNAKSVLMVSDTQEALDAVEDKIIAALNAIGVDDVFQNPILRLGKKTNNFNKIVNQNNYDKIKARHKSYVQKRVALDQEVEALTTALKNSVENDVNLEKTLQPGFALELLSFEMSPEFELIEKLGLQGRSGDADSVTGRGLVALKGALDELTVSKKGLEELGFAANVVRDIKGERISDLVDLLASLRLLEQAQVAAPMHYRAVVSEHVVMTLNEAIVKAERLRLPVIGHMLAGGSLRKLEDELVAKIPQAPRLSLPSSLSGLKKEVAAYRAAEIIEQGNVVPFPCLKAVRQEKLPEVIEGIESFLSRALEVKRAIKECPAINTVENVEVSANALSILGSEKRDAIERLSNYLDGISSLLSLTEATGNISFLEGQKRLQRRFLVKMSSIIDEAVICFKDERKNEATELGKCIRAKRKIPQSLLPALTGAFPCVIVGIRELAEYIPLAHELFDLVVIDEASQVSIAQAFPAILRAKKVVVLGDDKQFSSVKSSHASEAINRNLFQKVTQAFSESEKDRDAEERQRFEQKSANFNIKTSILDFVRNVANYSCSLRKHFRSYIELIDFSNERFYQKSLQVMKIRCRSISEVIEVVVVPPESEVTRELPNTNMAEARAIIRRLEELSTQGFNGSVGIITPFTNQQKLLSTLIAQSRNYNRYNRREGFNLKVWTFDTCQGQERDLIIYSMVEKAGEHKLNYIFPVSLNSASDEDDGTLKAQRLNVGLSRSMEKVCFFTSKPPSEFDGEIGKALRHFEGFLSAPDVGMLMNLTDKRSGRENDVLNFICQTNFWRENTGLLEIAPQFELGRYIKQLDPHAKIPNYKVDFLLIFRPAPGEDQKLIIEYDGFEWHFQDGGLVDEFNAHDMLIESDVERQKIIESYGYPVVRLNKFVLRRDPVQYIDNKLRETFCKKKTSDPFMNEIKLLYTRIESGKLKECERCKQVLPLSYFLDSTLASLYGRVCILCKSLKSNNRGRKGGMRLASAKGAQHPGAIMCPKCGSSMRLHSGVFGRFYGCIRFPKCPGERRA